MAKAFASIFKTAIKIIILLITVIYVAASFTPYINPINVKIYTFLALAFPYILFAMLVVCLLSIWALRKYSWLLFLLVLVGYKNILSTTGFHLFTADYAPSKAPKTLRLLSWNVNEFYSSDVSKDSANNPRRITLAFIKESNADILCFQDFKDFKEDEHHYSNTKYLRDSLNYPYVYLIVDHYPYTATGEEYGVAIFSRYPIVDTGRITYDSKDFPEHIGFADISINNKLLRFFTTHLSSMQLTAERKNAGLDYSYIQDDTAILLNKSKLEKISFFDSFHIRQAQLVKQQLNACNKPLIFCADLNSVPSSYVYQHISKGLQDAFLQKGFGWGATYDGLSHTLRIDVTLLSPELKVAQYYCPKLKASDHFPLVTDIAMP